MATVERCRAVSDGKQCTRERYHDVSMNATPHDFGVEVPMQTLQEFFAAGWLAAHKELGFECDLNDQAPVEWMKEYLQHRGRQ